MCKCFKIFFVPIPPSLFMFLRLCDMSPFMESCLICSVRKCHTWTLYESKLSAPMDVSPRHLDSPGVHYDNVIHQLVIAQFLASFLDGGFIDPTHYPLVDAIGYFRYPSILLLWLSN
jgi:hypothetical protein